MSILTINNLSKNYGAIRAVDNLSLTVEKGNIYGILGPNGSGKTTTLGIILGITNRDKGSFEWFEGKEGKNARKRLGALLEYPNFYPYLDAERNLDIVAHIKKVKQTNFDEILELVNLKHRKNSKFRTYSLGMKQRLAIAATMVGDPDVLIFDEPTNGLDPQGIAEVRETLLEIANRGKTVLMASHILDEVEKICSHVAIIKNGKLLATGTVGSILSNDISVEISSNDNARLRNLLGNHEKISNIEDHGTFLKLSVDESCSTTELNKLAFENGITLSHLHAKQKSLEDEFLEITKEN